MLTQRSASVMRFAGDLSSMGKLDVDSLSRKARISTALVLAEIGNLVAEGLWRWGKLEPPPIAAKPPRIRKRPPVRLKAPAPVYERKPPGDPFVSLESVIVSAGKISVRRDRVGLPCMMKPKVQAKPRELTPEEVSRGLRTWFKKRSKRLTLPEVSLLKPEDYLKIQRQRRGQTPRTADC